MNALVRPLPERELLIEDVELKVDDLNVAYASLVVKVRFYPDGMPYVFGVYEKDAKSAKPARSLSLPSAWIAALERAAEERYAPYTLEEV